jgi:anti-sigma regulatory factor (Ser/Thr protein kinase)
MQEGWSTATPEMRQRGFGAGLGLPNIRKNSDEFAIESTVGAGTTLRYAVHFAI